MIFFEFGGQFWAAILDGHEF